MYGFASVTDAVPGPRKPRSRNSCPGILLFIFAAFWLATSSVHADYFDDIGYTILQSELGPNLPDGSGVIYSAIVD